MAQSDNISLYIQTLPTYKLSSSELSDLLTLARQGNADAFIELVRAFIKPMLEFDRELAISKFSPLDHVVVTAIGVTRAVDRLVTWRFDPGEKQSSVLKQCLAYYMEYTLRFCNEERPTRIGNLFIRRMQRAVTQFFVENDRMPSLEEAVAQFKVMDDQKLPEGKVCAIAKLLFERSYNLHPDMTASQYLVTEVGETLAKNSRAEALQIRLSEPCLRAIADDIGRALSLSPEPTAEIKNRAITWYYGIREFFVFKDICLN